MKKRMIAFLLLLMLSMTAAFSDEPIEFYLLGSVRAKAAITITMFEEVFPFDLDSSEVAFNAATDVVYGLRIGQYTLFSNSGATRLYVSHSPLILDGTDGSDLNGQHRKIDYKLYLMVNNTIGEEDIVFMSCVSDASAATPDVATNRILLTGEVWLVNKSIYVSLDEGGSSATTQAVVQDLAEGIYKSNIYFLLEGE